MKTPSAVIVLLLASAFVWAQAAPEAKPSVESLIKQLSDDAPATREAAGKDLVDLGAAAVEPVDRARRESKDEDLKLRCDIILKRIGEKTGVTPESLAADRELKLPTSRVTLEFDRTPASDVLAELAKQSGNAPIKLINEPMSKKRISLSVRDMPYWEAFDRICDALRAIPQYAGPEGMMLIPRGKVVDLGAYAGPASVKLLSCSRRTTHTSTRHFRLPDGGENAQTEDERTVDINYSCSLEDRLPILSSRVAFDHARTPKGTDFAQQEAPAHAPEGFNGEDIGDEEREAEGGMSMGECSASFNDKDPADPGPMTLTGAVTMTLAVGRKEARIAPIAFGAADEHKPVVSGPYTIVLKDLTRNAGLATATLEITIKGGAPLIHQRAPKGQYGLRLVDPKGFAYAELQEYSFNSQNSSTSGSGENSEFQFHQVPDPETPGPEAVTLKVTFSHVGGEEGNWSLVLVHPERIEARSYPFTIKDVPLPQ